MKTFTILVLVAVAAGLARPEPSQAQVGLIGFGVHAARSNDILEGATGLGGQVAVRPPALPVNVRLAVDRFFPDCPEGADDCGAWGFTVDANLAFPMPVLRPYASAGIVRRSVSVDFDDPLAGAVDDASETGFALGGGLELGILGLNAFGEARYEILDDVDDGLMFRLGLLF